MRNINTHKVNPANDKLRILAADGPGQGGADHRYEIAGFDPTTNTSAVSNVDHVTILFQNGPIGEVGVNGITHEALLAVLIDRLQSFQKGPFASRENALALTHLETAKLWLFSRTLERMQRGVEGTNQV